VFSSVVDGLDKDTEMMKGIKKIVAEGKLIDKYLSSVFELLMNAVFEIENYFWNFLLQKIQYSTYKMR